MRTLKKSLALVLALVMVLGLGVVGASADDVYDSFTDTDEVGAAYVEAVGVLTGLGVVEGMSDTTPVISPQSTYTRAQAAKIIAVLLLGNEGAEALKCVEAPFDDVQPNQWFAGYVAYCAEKGIIDGMTATTFEPDGTLTGYQWAKMLLAAVGFGKNGEFVGGTWSLNTATVGTQSGLFTGDLDAADHTPIRREQAMLFAFNALTKLRQVTYSANSNNYVYGIKGYFFADNTGLTLGQSTFNLNSVEGVIIDSEGVGADATVVDNYNYEGKLWQDAEVTVKANTEIDEMYHAVRLWYVEGAKENTGVYTYDLAKVTTTNCPDADDCAKAKVIGTVGTYYRLDVVDNSALDEDLSTNVAYKAAVAKRGVHSDTKANTVIYVNGTADHAADADVMTDISEIEINDEIIVLRAESTKNSANEAWYISAIGATDGNVESVSDKGVITLTDGTVLEPSNLATANPDRSELSTLIGILGASGHVAPHYYFTLDTHGHYMGLTQNPYKTVAYFTGAWAITSDANGYIPEATYKAQFVDVKTGAVKEVPVTAAWVVDAYADAAEGYHYYDITDELFGDATYEPGLVFVTNALYGVEYAHSNSKTFTMSDTTNIIDLTAGFDNDGTARFEDATVTYIIASGSGTTIDVDTYVGTEAFIAGYAEKHGLPVSSVTLSDIALVYTTTPTNKVATVVFAYDTRATGGYAFFPQGLDKWSLVAATYYQYNFAYLNGETEVSPLKVAGTVTVDGVRQSAATLNLERGFYTYTLNAQGQVVDLHRLPTAEFVYDKEDIEVAGNESWIKVGGTTYYPTADCKVVDTRTGTDIDKVQDFSGLLVGHLWDDNYNLQLAFVPATDNSVSVIYVVENNLGLAEVTVDRSLTGWTVEDRTVYEDETVVLKNDAALAGLENGTDVLVSGTVSDTVGSKPFNDVAGKVVVADGKPSIEVTLKNIAGINFETIDVEIDEVTMIVKIENKTDFNIEWGTAPNSSPNKYDAEDGIEINVGDKLNIAFANEESGKIAEGIVSTVALTGASNADKDYTVTWKKAADNDWARLEQLTVNGNDITINSVLSDYTFKLQTGDSATKFAFTRDDNDDALKIEDVVPGEKVEFSIIRTVAGGEVGKDLVINEKIHSNNPSTGKQYDEFEFDFVPGANELTISLTWADETQESNPAVGA